MLDIWPALPLVILDSTFPREGGDNDNVIAVLTHSDRVREISLGGIPGLHLEKILAAMQKPFPALTKLILSVKGDTDLVIPDSFLGGPAPRLHTIGLRRCSFLGMQKLLLSAKDLVTLSLEDIPHSGYISPDAMVAALSVMTRLGSLHLGFGSPQSRPDPESQRAPPLTRAVLPALTRLTFKGVHKYSESLMAQIDAPHLENLFITFFEPTVLIVVVPQLHRFIIQIEAFKTFRHAKVFGGYDSMACTLSSRGDQVESSVQLSLKICCRRVDWQLLSLAQVCSWSLSPISVVEELEVEVRSLSSSRPRGNDIMMEPESTQWLELLGPFTAVKNLTLSPGITSRVCRALKEITEERITEVLPALQNLFLYDGYPLESSRKAIKIFVAARRRSGHLLCVHSGPWGGRRKDITEDLMSED